MKKYTLLTLAAAVIFVLPCCVQNTTTHPDGSVTVTKEPDRDLIRWGAKTAITVIPRQ